MNVRQLALYTLRAIYHKGAFADVALDRTLRKNTLSSADRRLLTELVYGIVRRQRTLDALIDQLAKKKAHQQHPDIRIILHIGLYQLRYLDHIPDSEGVHTTVEMVKQNKLARLKGYVNRLLREYLRLSASGALDLLGALANQDVRRERRTKSRCAALKPSATHLSATQDQGARHVRRATHLIGIQHSYPDWMVQVWSEQIGLAETEALCAYLNQPPPLDLRVNPLRSSRDTLKKALHAAGYATEALPFLPQVVRVKGATGPVRSLPGFNEGKWVVQDSSAQLVSHLLDPQPGETIIDACAAPGGKSTHIAELMQDQGIVWACDRYAARLRKVKANAKRLGLRTIRTREADSRHIPDFHQQADRVLLDAPCSGLGTLNRHADARWRQTPERVAELVILQQELLNEAANWVKIGGILVYATCSLHPHENEQQIQRFLAHHPTWRISLPPTDSPATRFITPEGWLNVWPHRDKMDGFFMVRLQKEG